MSTSPSATTVVDLFAGAGGWDEGLGELGHHAVGIETDAMACTTAEAAGHRREPIDVAQAEPHRFGPALGLIGSPPCQADSPAGKGLGRLDRPHVLACARELAKGHDTRAGHLARCQDQRSLLTVEPLRWALELHPDWIALEQVPPVLELWSLFAELLAGHGYHCAVGLLSAERYGVPQTRKRAYLIANRRRPVALPVPTHRSYDPRHPDRVLDDERALLPWVSMSQALAVEPDAVHYSNCHHSEQRPRGMVRSASHPSRTVDTKAGEWTISHEACADHSARSQGDHRPARHARQTHRAQRGEATCARVAGPSRGRIGRRGVRGSEAGRVVRRPPIGERLSVEQAGVLQGFRSDYPWQGSRTRCFRQVGNAVCPPMARHVLAAAMASEDAHA
jgi:DNA (cytosine-5)-methyltransferase 1